MEILMGILWIVLWVCVAIVGLGFLGLAIGPEKVEHAWRWLVGAITDAGLFLKKQSWRILMAEKYPEPDKIGETSPDSPLPCPFCGQRPEIIYENLGSGRERWRISCENRECLMLVYSPWVYTNAEDAVKLWNRRCAGLHEAERIQELDAWKRVTLMRLSFLLGDGRPATPDQVRAALADLASEQIGGRLS